MKTKNRQSFTSINPQVTLESRSIVERIYDWYSNPYGLEQHAFKSNHQLKEWLQHEEEKELAKVVNQISMDFVDSEVVHLIIELNRKKM